MKYTTRRRIEPEAAAQGRGMYPSHAIKDPNRSGCR